MRIESMVCAGLTRVADLIESVGTEIERIGGGLREGRLDVGPVRVITAKSMASVWMNAFELGVDHGRAPKPALKPHKREPGHLRAVKV